MGKFVRKSWVVDTPVTLHISGHLYFSLIFKTPSLAQQKTTRRFGLVRTENTTTTHWLKNDNRAPSSNKHENLI